MKVRYLLVVWTVASVFLGIIGQQGEAEEIVRLTNGEWPPYFSENLPHYGIGSRIVTEAFALEGIRVEYAFFPWKRALATAQSGEFDGAVGWQTNPEREQNFYSSETVWEAPWVFFHLKTKSFDWNSLADLKSLAIGGTLEYMYTPEFLEAEKAGAITVDRARRDELSWKKLVAGRIDIFPQLLDIGNVQIQEDLDPDARNLITYHPKPLGMHAEQLLLSKKHERNAQLIEIFNRGLQRLKESGKYDQYFEELRGTIHPE